MKNEEVYRITQAGKSYKGYKRGHIIAVLTQQI